MCLDVRPTMEAQARITGIRSSDQSLHLVRSLLSATSSIRSTPPQSSILLAPPFNQSALSTRAEIKVGGALFSQVLSPGAGIRFSALRAGPVVSAAQLASIRPGQVITQEQLAVMQGLVHGSSAGLVQGSSTGLVHGSGAGLVYGSSAGLVQGSAAQQGKVQGLGGSLQQGTNKGKMFVSEGQGIGRMAGTPVVLGSQIIVEKQTIGQNIGVAGSQTVVQNPTFARAQTIRQTLVGGNQESLIIAGNQTMSSSQAVLVSQGEIVSQAVAGNQTRQVVLGKTQEVKSLGNAEKGD